ncbi:NifB/NifX family molybdenum-iron cluster-binding protein [bacterium]|nr:NifB/NifX family molybdenum-iron cluster-binding protein [bacterium]
MKIAFTATGNNWLEKVDIRFGRAQGFFIVDTETNETSYIDNNLNVETAHGAGTSAAQSVVDAGVNALVTGQLGPKAASVLRAAGIKVYGGVGYATIEEAYQRYKQGKLNEQ